MIVWFEVVDARRQDQVLAAGQCLVDLRYGVAWLGDEELADRDGRPGVGTVGPCGAHGVALHGGHEDAVVPGWSPCTGMAPLASPGWSPASCTGHRMLLSRETLGGRTHGAGEHLVPDAVAPAVELAVPDEELLLRAVDHVAAVNCESAMKPPLANDGPGAIVHQGGVSVDLTRRIGAACDTAQNSVLEQPIRVGHVDGQVRQRAPEVIERDAVVGTETLVVDIDGPVDDHVVGRETETRHASVVADLKVERVGTGAVGAGLEQQRITLSAELVGDLLGGYRVNRRLDLALRHAGVEDIDVRAEVGLARRR